MIIEDRLCRWVFIDLIIKVYFFISLNFGVVLCVFVILFFYLIFFLIFVNCFVREVILLVLER